MKLVEQNKTQIQKKFKKKEELLYRCRILFMVITTQTLAPWKNAMKRGTLTFALKKHKGWNLHTAKQKKNLEMKKENKKMDKMMKLL